MGKRATLTITSLVFPMPSIDTQLERGLKPLCSWGAPRVQDSYITRALPEVDEFFARDEDPKCRAAPFCLGERLVRSMATSRMPLVFVAGHKSKIVSSQLNPSFSWGHMPAWRLYQPSPLGGPPFSDVDKIKGGNLIHAISRYRT